MCIGYLAFELGRIFSKPNNADEERVKARFSAGPPSWFWATRPKRYLAFK
jgi:hypothetical protein